MVHRELSLVKDSFPVIGQGAREEMIAALISIVTVANLYF
jgi:hypothetical protein